MLVRSRPPRGSDSSAPGWAGKRLPRPAGTPFGSADPDQLLVDELVRTVLAQLASRTGALDAAERQLGAVGADDVDVHHAGVDLVRDSIGLIGVGREQV